MRHLTVFREPLGADGKHGRMSGEGAAQRDPAQPDRLGGRGTRNKGSTTEHKGSETKK